MKIASFQLLLELVRNGTLNFVSQIFKRRGAATSNLCYGNYCELRVFSLLRVLSFTIKELLITVLPLTSLEFILQVAVSLTL